MFLRFELIGFWNGAYFIAHLHYHLQASFALSSFVCHQFHFYFCLISLVMVHKGHRHFITNSISYKRGILEGATTGNFNCHRRKTDKQTWAACFFFSFVLIAENKEEVFFLFFSSGSEHELGGILCRGIMWQKFGLRRIFPLMHTWL